MRLDDALRPQLETLKAQQLYRRPLTRGAGGVPELELEGRRLLNFCSNDYLGLAQDPRVTRAFVRAARHHGVGSGAAHLVTGHHREHAALEEALADWLGRERVLLFSTGYMANLGVLDALLEPGDLAAEDRLNHASLLDGARLSGARLRRYQHADAAHLGRRLAGSYRRRLVVTDGVFSMDGDLAPLPALVDACAAHDAWLMVDDAHGLGVSGPEGRGSAAGFSTEQVPILVGTLGKAFGTYGAFVAGSQALIETLIQRARTYIYTTAPPPAVAAASHAALTIIRGDDELRPRLAALVQRFRAGVEALGLVATESATPIQPLLLGSAERALSASRALRERGLLVTAIRPPTVPAGTARLRVTLTAAHSPEQVDLLLEALDDVLRTPA